MSVPFVRNQMSLLIEGAREEFWVYRVKIPRSKKTADLANWSLTKPSILNFKALNPDLLTPTSPTG